MRRAQGLGQLPFQGAAQHEGGAEAVVVAPALAVGPAPVQVAQYLAAVGLEHQVGGEALDRPQPGLDPGLVLWAERIGAYGQFRQPAQVLGQEPGERPGVVGVAHHYRVALQIHVLVAVGEGLQGLVVVPAAPAQGGLGHGRGQLQPPGHGPQEIAAGRGADGQARGQPGRAVPLLGKGRGLQPVDIRNHDVQLRLAGGADALQGVLQGEEGVHLQPQAFQQGPDAPQVAAPERVQPRGHAPQVDLAALGLGGPHEVVEQGLQHQIIALVGVALETAGVGAEDAHALGLEVPDHRQDVVADDLGDAAGEDHVQLARHHLQGVGHLLAEPGVAAEHHLVLLQVGTGDGQGAAVAAHLQGRAAVLGPGEAAGAAGRGVQDGDPAGQRVDREGGAPQRAGAAGPFDEVGAHRASFR